MYGPPTDSYVGLMPHEIRISVSDVNSLGERCYRAAGALDNSAATNNLSFGENQEVTEAYTTFLADWDECLGQLITAIRFAGRQFNNIARTFREIDEQHADLARTG